MRAFTAVLFAFLYCLNFARASLTFEEVYYDFSTSGCPGVAPGFGPIRLGGLATLDGELYVLSALSLQVLKISEDVNGTRTCSIYGYLPLVPTPGYSGPLANPGTFSLGMQADPSGNIYVTNSGLGPGTADHGSVWKVPIDAVAQPIRATRIAVSTADLSFFSGIEVDWRHNSLLITSEIDGLVYQTNLLDYSLSVWADLAQLKGTGKSPGQPGADSTNTNLLAFPIGSVGIRLSNNGKNAYIGSGDQGLEVQVEVDKHTGVAGPATVVGSAPQHTVEGVVVAKNEKTLYFTTVFANGTNLTPDSLTGEYQGGVLPGRAVWVTDIKTGVSSRFYDAQLGCPTGIVSGSGLGDSNILLVANSGFDALPFWPMGAVRNNDIRAPYPAAVGSTFGAAFAGQAYEAKIVVLRIL